MTPHGARLALGLASGGSASGVLAVGVFAVGLWAYLRYVWYAGPTLTWARRGERVRAPGAADARDRAARAVLPLDRRPVARRPAAGRSASLSVVLRIAFVGAARARPRAPRAHGDDAEGVHRVPRRRERQRAPTRRSTTRAPRSSGARRARPATTSCALVTFAQAPARRRRSATTPTPLDRRARGARRAAAGAPRARPRRRDRHRERAAARLRPLSARGTCAARSSSPTACRPTATSSPRRTARKLFGVKLFAVPYKRPVPGEVAVRELRAARQGARGRDRSTSTPRSSRPSRRRAKLVAQAGRGDQRPRRRERGRPHGRRQRRRLQERRARAGRGDVRARGHRRRRGPLQGEQPRRRPSAAVVGHAGRPLRRGQPRARERTSRAR